MNISNVNAWIGAIVGGCAFATFLYKIWRTLNTGVEANKKRTQSLNDRLDAHDITLDEIIYYLALPEEDGKKKIPFNNNISLQNLRRKALENYDGRNTSGFS